MYLLKKEIDFKNQNNVAEEIGINISTLSRILNKKQTCSKIIAYCLVKYYDKEAEINDYFTRI